MFHKIRNVITKNNFILEVEFENNIKKEYDIKNIMKKYEIFKKLEDINLYKNIKVDVGGYGISWSAEIDISCEELWNNGVKKL